MILVDSSGWIEYFTNGPLAGKFDPYMKNTRRIVTPTIVLYEVYKKIKRERSEAEALQAAAQMMKTHVVALTEEIALSAADVGLEHSLPMADAIVYATALENRCKLLTMDSDFARLPGTVVLQ